MSADDPKRQDLSAPDAGSAENPLNPKEGGGSIEIATPNNPLPKRSPGRPRLSESEKRERALMRKSGKVIVVKHKKKFKYKKQTDISLVVPMLPLVWRARKMLWLIHNIEMHLKEDPTFISPKEYFSLLKDMEAIYTELEKEGQGTHELRREARERIRSERLADDGREVVSSRDSKDESSGLGARVPAVDPFRRQG